MSLAFAIVDAANARAPAGATRAVLFLHGIFGQGGNFRTIARRFVDAHPTWRAILVDLRAHGRSLDVTGPHTIRHAAEDLFELDGEVGVPIDGVVGHSFGGKVALEYVALRSGAIDRAWILDASPGERRDAHGSETVLAVLDALASLPPRFATRDAFHSALAAAGLDAAIVAWLAMNLARDGEAFRFKLDLVAIRALLDDYFARDLWPTVRSPPGRVRIEFLLGERSTVFSAADRDELARAARENPTRIGYVTIPGAGHWVHADAPDAVVDRLIETA